MNKKDVWLESQCNDLHLLVGNIANTIPVRDVIVASGTNESLVAYFKDLHNQRDTLLSAMKRIAAYPETIQQELGIEAIKAIARVAIENAEGGENEPGDK